MKTGIRTAPVSTFTSPLPTVWSPTSVAGYVHGANWAMGTLFQFQFAARKFTLVLVLHKKNQQLKVFCSQGRGLSPRSSACSSVPAKTVQFTEMLCIQCHTKFRSLLADTDTPHRHLHPGMFAWRASALSVAPVIEHQNRRTCGGDFSDLQKAVSGVSAFPRKYRCDERSSGAP